jgi:hypothetical protein
MASFFSKFFKSTPSKSERVSNFSPGQQNIYDLLNQAIMGEGPFADLFGGFDPDQINELFQQGIAAPARRQFQERTLPGLEQRAIGSGLTRSSGMFRQGMEAEGDLEDRLNELLARQQMGAQESAMGRQMSAIDALLGTPESRIETTPGRPSSASQVLPGLIGKAGSAFLGPLAGAAGEHISQKIFKR